MTELSIALKACGLSITEAADFLGVRIDTIQKCAKGKAPTPPRWLVELTSLCNQIERSAQEGLGLINQKRAEYYKPDSLIEVKIGVASDDHEAKALGFPCIGAHKAVCARIWSRRPERVTIHFVPRGSTLGLAAAADAHEH